MCVYVYICVYTFKSRRSAVLVEMYKCTYIHLYIAGRGWKAQGVLTKSHE